ncbi:ribosomal protein S18-alanine N-acetyltransferase [Pseudidiomarina mangrovi]|uniref:ribosomal protein S18-alanine N-acetyltransferase n=1 Tax=Pseudidiomarina mangrovi TaxID=2487133 RepID=UPI000FCB4FB1|nr:ribosomal protein S18-alanine N-acetyltransferase [Pseudidiomarina mangrovi]
MAASQPIISNLAWHPEVAVLEQAAHHLPWTEAILQSCFTEGYRNFGYWSAADELLGFALVQTVPGSWTIMNIVTKPSAQRQGIGQQLVAHIQQCARHHQAEIILEVRVSNLAAQRLYQRSGFVVVGRRKDYYALPEHGREDALVMQWSA